MDINKILKGVKCSNCGKDHACPIKYVYVENGAISHLNEIANEYKSILIVADENTYGAAGQGAESALTGKKIKNVIFSGKTVLIPNEDAINRVNGEIAGVDLIVGIGSGVIQDLCKYVSHFSGIPYLVVATAPSMDGYASTGAAMILGGMKETVSAGLPIAIIADTGVLKNAPMEMIKAGYGDIIGKYSALNDWELSRVVNGEYFCQYIYDTTYEMIEKTLKTAKGLLNRDEESIRALTEALIVVGIMMSFATTSRPASGSEHHLSHFFEITGIVKNQPYFPHGIDVAYSTVITAGIREKLLKKPLPSISYKEDKEAYISKINEVYGEVANGCIALQEKMGRYNVDRLPIYKENEKEIRSILEKMPSAEKIKEMLSLCQLDISEFYELYGKEKIENAVKYAKDLKDRYTVLWLNYDLGE
ncbi:MAG: sn-glycerol-1-phosphate dehydrogenase [Clostridia bacterium]|nr:sn-glycerol-1-phosphate dehydrogenase [Clostridia bacterium]